jgi:abnormal spindle-like microcephaly-associated protein
MATPSSHRRLQQRTNEVSSSKCIAGGIVDDWAEKQSETFVNWLNYTINPSDDDQAVDVVGTVGSPSCAGLRMLLLHRQLAQSRMKASGVFYDDEMQKVKNKIHSEISRGRLSIRSDRDIYYDLNLRRQVTALLQSYTTPWLRLGLEVLFGESIQVENSAHNLSKVSLQSI